MKDSVKFRKKHSKTDYTVWYSRGHNSIAFNVVIEHDLITEGRGQWIAFVDDKRIGVARSENDIKIKIQIHVRHLVEQEDNS